jgi:2-dehydro-3-deoxyphosphooctonate aldolase (KDO 8-P synthase)
VSRGIRIKGITIGGNAPLVVIAGPCVIEGKAFTISLAKQLQEICRNLAIPFVFKASYDKANRTSIS